MIEWASWYAMPVLTSHMDWGLGVGVVNDKWYFSAVKHHIHMLDED